MLSPPSRAVPIRRLRYALFVPLLAGCYVYRPVETASVPANHHVRLVLTDAGSVALAPELGPSVVAVGGTLMHDSGDAFVLALRDTWKRNGVETGWVGEQVSISKSLASSVQQRKFSPARTAAVSLGLIAGIFAAREAFWGPGGVFGGPNPGPGPGPR